MADFRRTLGNPAYLYGSTTFLLFFGSWGIWWSFFQIWLTSESGGLQLTGSQVGTVYAINGVGTLVCMIIYGAGQDRLGLRRHLVRTAAALMCLVGPFAQWIYRPLLESHFYLGAVAGAIFLSAAFLGSCGLFEAFVERLSRYTNFEFGQARMWGSFGYAIVALIAGFLFTVNPLLNFWIGSALGLLLLLIQLFWVPRTEEQETAASADAIPSAKEMLSLLGDKKVWALIGFVFLSWTFYTVFDQQMFPDFYTTLFQTPAQGQHAYGVLNSIQVFLEAAMMGIIPFLVRKVGGRNTLLLGVLVMFLRISACGFFTNPVLISIAKMCHSLEVPLFVLGVFKYLALHFNHALSATLYLVAFNLSAQIGNVILSSPLGALRDSIGYQPTFHVVSAIVAVAAVYAFFVLRRDKQAINPEEIPTR
ncbi:oligosaccharide MFS transporter [Gleimia hominis]|uniref:Oligosaccharide MFS transporter n=1 Tax=Gleimia hominis TaxID=595468 RepID=A0ABU3IC50_9ACTO|nr:oligosaccharide MFS transporter [Gleimia hominis]MDT3767953.1 oligosaccharide MFS transporter [Gleimia hominis]